MMERKQDKGNRSRESVTRGDIFPWFLSFWRKEFSQETALTELHKSKVYGKKVHSEIWSGLTQEMEAVSPYIVWEFLSLWVELSCPLPL